MDTSNIRYAQVWEDPSVLRRGLRVQPGERVFSVGAAGDNALALLLDDPAEVVAVDMSPAQIALFELKLAALRRLDHGALLEFFGVRDGRDRGETWAELRPGVSGPSRAFFDERPDEIATGLLHAGKFERYFAIFRRTMLPLVQSRRTVREYLASPGLEEQRGIFQRRWDNRRWRALFRVFFGKLLLGKLGRDPALFEHIEEGAVGDRLLARVSRAFEKVPVKDNFFVEYILTGRYSGRHGLPPWLEAKNHATLRARLDRLKIIEGRVESVLDDARGFDAFNLSDIFEWMSPADTEKAYARVLGAARPGARLVSWNLLANRERPLSMASRIEVDRERSRALSREDRAFFYDRAVVEEVRA
jgi:S-adenosylmethionine-diacylglycerol 3-amino-3-carboxypropyl transferase